MYDVIIVGAGVAGSFLAWQLGRIGLKVLLIEKNREVKIDSGIVSSDINNILRIRSSLIKYKIKKMKFISSSGFSFYLKSKKPFALILRREKFGKWLRRVALNSSDFVMEECRRISVGRNITVRTNKNIYRSKILIGADGALSIIRKQIGFRDPRIFFGLMTKGPTYDNVPVVWFDKRFSRYFFSWFSPPHEYGLIERKSLMAYLRVFRRRIGVKFRNLYVRPIPIGPTRSVYKNVLLVGDAAGQVKPISGGGIVYSLRSSEIMIDVLDRFFNGKGRPNEYEKRWHSLLMKEIKLQLLVRKVYSRISNKQIDLFFREFSPVIERINIFDYDRILTILKKVPKYKIIKYMVKLWLK